MSVQIHNYARFNKIKRSVQIQVTKLRSPCTFFGHLLKSSQVYTTYIYIIQVHERFLLLENKYLAREAKCPTLPNYSSTNSLYSQILSCYWQSCGFADGTSVLHNQPLLYALRMIFMSAVKSSYLFLVVVISLKEKI